MVGWQAVRKFDGALARLSVPNVIIDSKVAQVLQEEGGWRKTHGWVRGLQQQRTKLEDTFVT